MRKLSLALFMMCSIGFAYAQEFPTAWKSKFSFKPDRWFYDDNGKYILGRTSEEAEVLDGATGKSIWKLNFKNDLKAKEIHKATYNQAEGIVLFFNQDEKKKNGEKVVVELATGKVLWRGDQYVGTDADDNFHFANSVSSLTAKGTTIIFNDATKKFTGLDLKTGAVKWESQAYPAVSLEKNINIQPIKNSEYAQVFIEDEDISKMQILYMSIVTGEVLKDESRFTSSNEDYEVSYSGKIIIRQTIDGTTLKLTGTMKELGFKIKFELEASGANAWKKEWESKAVREIMGDDPYVKLDVQGGKIFVMSKEIAVLDLKTGNQLWTAPFDNCDASVGLKAKQEFGIAGWPLVSGGAVYYVDLENDNAIKKVDGNTGKLIWKSDKLKSNDRVPNLVMINGVLVAQFGGRINVQTYIASSNGGETRKSEYKYDGNYGVRAFDPASGKLLWSTEQLASKIGDKFSSRISAIYPLNNKVVVATGDNLLSLDPKTGDVVYKTSLTDAKIGDMFEVHASKDYETLFIFCDEGIAAAEASTGKLKYATKTGEIQWKFHMSGRYSFQEGNNLFIWVGEKDFIGFDLASGKIKGKMKDNDNPQLTDGGNVILLRDGDKVSKFLVNN